MKSHIQRSNFSTASKGFTLIELLVVISIIGLLSSIILVSVSSARLKGKDASAMATMVSMKNSAELVRSVYGYPSNTCTSVLLTLINGVELQVPGDVVCEVALLFSGSYKRWAAEVTLNNGTNFCVDSTGYAGPRALSNGLAVCGGTISS